MAAIDEAAVQTLPSGNLSGSRKRKHEDDDTCNADQMPTLPCQPELPEFSLTRRPSQDSGILKNEVLDERAGSEGWQTVENRPRKKKKIPKHDSKNYPAIQFSSECRLQSQIKISDLQQLVLYILADGPSPQFVAVRHRPEIRKVVVLMVPGLEMSMFRAKALEAESREDSSHGSRRDRNDRSPDDFYPNRLKTDKLPESLQQFADMFEHVWPVKTPGDEKFGKMHSPLHAMLTAPMTKSRDEKKWSKNRKGAAPAKEPHGWRNTRVPVPEFVHTPEELLENEYPLHPASYSEGVEKANFAEYRRTNGTSTENGWVDTMVEHLKDGTPPENEVESGSITAGREILAMDCEMCVTGRQEGSRDELSLTRISIVGWDGSVVLDELVKPDKPIIDYVTQYSGITEAMIAPVTTTLSDIQKKLVEILHPRTILIGHSLNSDLNALQVTHPFIIDTAIIYPHPRGPPLKSSLKWLAQKYLNREIQKGHGTTGPAAGHNSVEDAKTCLDLLKQKCEKGKDWGTSDSQGENIFKRVARTGVTYKSQGGSAIPSPLNGKSSAAVDWGEPRKGPGAAANFPIGCQSDEEVMNAVIRAVKGDHDGKEIPGGGVDFVWARFRELEALKGWWNNNKVIAAGAAAAIDAEAVAATSVPVSEAGNLFTFKQGEGIEASIAAPTPPLSTPAPPTALPPPAQLVTTSIETATTDLTRRIAKIYEELPACTAFVIYSGSGDPREMSRLQAMQAQFKKEYKFKKWDELSVKWTDTEEQALKRAFRVARNGLAFVGVK
ncbi:hypothetical protein QTJ16_000272 [Diplocarpon rosae]|uniref:Exonuclease domain-containing protein n=1 Tax=Diplocarpon rosae TaxID=946125 RepID=A0AAD9T619_9HELO|nr:hypothetical protein QTJ16_000272 [Diplocarpon rosae]